MNTEEKKGDEVLDKNINKKESNHFEMPILSVDIINEFSHNKILLEFIRKEFKRCSYDSAASLIKLLFYNTKTIKITQIAKKFGNLLRYNKGKFDKDNF